MDGPADKRRLSTVGGDLYKGYGEKFLTGQPQLRTLGGSTELGSRPRFLWMDLEFPRLTTPKGMTEDPEVVRLKGLWESAKDCREEAGSHAGGQRRRRPWRTCGPWPRP